MQGSNKRKDLREGRSHYCNHSSEAVNSYKKEARKAVRQQARQQLDRVMKAEDPEDVDVNAPIYGCEWWS